MKQHIAPEQIMELTKDQSDRLLGWLSNHGYYDTGFPEITIGQMIEFLNESKNGWNLTAKAILDPDSETHKPVESWCDALWEAVKQVLEK